MSHSAHKSHSPIEHFPSIASHNVHVEMQNHAHGAAPTHDAIAHRAYEIYVKSGCTHGNCDRNWQMAEKSLHEPAALNKPEAGPAATHTLATPTRLK